MSSASSSNAHSGAPEHTYSTRSHSRNASEHPGRDLGPSDGLRRTNPRSAAFITDAGARDVVDLTVDSGEEEEEEEEEDEEVVYVGGSAAQQQGMRNSIQEIDRVLADRRQQLDHIAMDEERRRDVLSPPFVPRRPIGLGGAVLRRGDQRLQFRPFRRATPVPDPRQIIGEARWGDVPPLPPFERRHEDLNVDHLYDIRRFGRRAVREMPAVGHELHDPPPGAAPGPAGLPDLHAILATIPKLDVIKPKAGFTDVFDLTATIVIDDMTERQGHLSCFRCHDRLRLSSKYRNEDDRVWALRCGHLLHQKCLRALCTPISEKAKAAVTPPLRILPVLDAPLAKRKKVSKKPQSHEYFWSCPGKDCGQYHTSVLYPGALEWAQRPGEGAIQVFM